MIIIQTREVELCFCGPNSTEIHLFEDIEIKMGNRSRIKQKAALIETRVQANNFAFRESYRGQEPIPPKNEMRLRIDRNTHLLLFMILQLTYISENQLIRTCKHIILSNTSIYIQILSKDAREKWKQAIKQVMKSDYRMIAMYFQCFQERILSVMIELNNFVTKNY